MNAGERFAIAGYDLLAFARAMDGRDLDQEEVVVLGNNFSHFLVAFRERNAPSAVLVKAFRYAYPRLDAALEGEDPDIFIDTQYRRALDMMVRLAKEH